MPTLRLSSPSSRLSLLILLSAIAAVSAAVTSPVALAATDEYNIIIDIVDFEPEDDCECGEVSTSMVNDCYVGTNTEDNNVGYRGQDGSPEDGWEISLVAKYRGGIGRQYRTAYIHEDGSTTPDGHGDLVIVGFAPTDDPDFLCDSNEYYDRYHVTWEVQDVISSGGNTYFLEEMNYAVSDIDDDYILDHPSTSTCFDRAFCSCLGCGPVDIFTTSTPVTETVYVIVEETSP